MNTTDLIIMTPIIIVLYTIILFIFIAPFICTYLLLKCLDNIKNNFFSFKIRVFLFFGLVIIPILFFLSTLIMFMSSSRYQKDSHWIYYINDLQAGIILLPIYLIASSRLTMSIFDREYMVTSRSNYIMVATLAGIMAWYTLVAFGASINIYQMSSQEYFVQSFMFGIICFNYIIFLKIINKMNHLKTVNPLFVYIWFLTLVSSILAKYPLAKQVYNQLSESSDCFIVSAAANGHPKIVKSTVNQNTGKIVNYQLYIFRTFEAKLANSFPNIHRKLRIIYNRIGPCIAKQIRYRWQADVIYLLLKPLELVVRLGLLIKSKIYW